MRRGESYKITIAGRSMRTPKDWKEFLKNEDNKKQLVNFLLTEWQQDTYATALQNREIYFAGDNSCYILTSLDVISTESRIINKLSTSQEEADTIMILHSLYADTEEEDDIDIIVRSADTDVFVLLSSFCYQCKHPLYFDTGSSNKRRIIPIQTAYVRNQEGNSREYFRTSCFHRVRLQ